MQHSHAARVNAAGNRRPASRATAEGILQLRAAALSEDCRLDRYFQERPGLPSRRNQKQGDHTAPAKAATSQTR
jgi:hypothetical protein